MGQVFASTMVADFYAGLAKEFTLHRGAGRHDGQQALVRKLPVGVVGGIVPWNVPLFTTMLKLAPAMVAGCHHGAEAGTRDAARRVGARRDRRTRPACPPACSTSSPPAARWASTSSPTRTSTRSRSPAAPPPAARSPRCAASASAASPSSWAASRPRSSWTTPTSPRSCPPLVPAGIMNNGQACVAQTRILASRDRYDEVVEAIAEAVGNLKVGDPLDPEPPRSARSSPSASATGSRATSPRPGARAPRSSSAAAARPISRRAGSSSPPCSPTSTTR